MSIPARQDETQNEARNETDERLLDAVPWAGDPRREEETNRLQQAVIEAAQRLGHEPVEPSLQTTAQPVRTRMVSFRLAVPEPREGSSLREDSSQASGQD